MVQIEDKLGQHDEGQDKQGGDQVEKEQPADELEQGEEATAVSSCCCWVVNGGG